VVEEVSAIAEPREKADLTESNRLYVMGVHTRSG
jgi:hypothetical protein